MTRRAAKIDTTHQPIAQALEQCGYLVLSLAPLGNGAPDLLIFSPGRGFALIEVKTGKGKLRPKQIAFQEAGWPVTVLRNLDEVAAWVSR